MSLSRLAAEKDIMSSVTPRTGARGSWRNPMKSLLVSLLLAVFLFLISPVVVPAAPISIQLSGTASFYDVAYSNVSRLEISGTNTAAYPDYTSVEVLDAGYDDRYHSRRQWASISAVTANPINWSTAFVNITEWSDGNSVLVLSFSNLGLGDCTSEHQTATDALLSTCSSPDGSTISYNRWSEEFGYYEYAFDSYEYTEYWNDGSVFTYSDNSQWGPHQDLYDQHGVMMPAGSQYGFDIEIHDGETTYLASARMILQPSGWANGYSWTCEDLTGSAGGYCSESLETNFQRWGNVAFSPGFSIQELNPPTDVPETGSLTFLCAGLLFALFWLA